MSKTNLGSNQQDINQQGIKAAGAERPVLQEAVGTVKAAQGEHKKGWRYGPLIL